MLIQEHLPIPCLALHINLRSENFLSLAGQQRDGPDQETPVPVTSLVHLAPQRQADPPGAPPDPVRLSFDPAHCLRAS